MSDRDTEQQIQHVRRTARLMRYLCVLVGVMLALMSLLTLKTILVGGSAQFALDAGPYSIHGDQFNSVATRAWGLVVFGTVFALLLAGLYYLHQLFASLQGGAIFTRENVRLVRALAHLSVASVAVQIILPLVSQVLLQSGVIDAGSVSVTHERAAFGLQGGPSIVSAVVLWLAAWIMDVGRRTRDEAEAMRRDAELVV